MSRPRKSAAAKSASAKPTSAQVTLSASRDIPLDRLVLAQTNVRRLKAGLSIEELAEDIARRTLLQSLSVRPILDETGAETGRYEIPAGGRRFRALQLLVQQKRLAKDAPIPCIVRTEGLAEEDSLAENVQRVALHPLDQFRAFAALREQGLGEEAIAARFFVTPQVVRQRLKLAAASPTLLDVYAADELTLDQLMAFCVSDDHARQEQVWDAIQRGWNKEPHYIRRLLTEDSVAASDRRAVFVGVEAYEAAGGTVLRDLFQQDRGGWLQDVALLDRLVLEKLEAEAGGIRAEGWAWVQVGLDFPYGHTAGLRRLNGEVRPLTEAEQASLDALQAEHDALSAAHDEAEELPDEVEARFDELETAIAAIEERPLVYDPAEVARAGAFVSIGHDGGLRVERGFVRPADAAIASDSRPGDGTDRSPAAAGPGRAGPSRCRRPGRERGDCRCRGLRGGGLASAARSARDGADRPPHAGAARRTGERPRHHLPRGAPRPVPFAVPAPGERLVPGNRREERDLHGTGAGSRRDRTGPVGGSPARRLGAAAAGRAGCPVAFLAELDHDSRMALFAHCAAQTVNTVHEPWNRRPEALAQPDRLAGAVGLDLAASWAPTTANYLGRVSKAHILAAVREARGEAAAQLIDHLRKADMAREAERLLAGIGWLPEPLRLPGGEPAVMPELADAGAAMVDESLPAFLTADDPDVVGETAVSRAFERNATAVLAA